MIVGTQGVSGRDFAVLREVHTGILAGPAVPGSGPRHRDALRRPAPGASPAWARSSPSPSAFTDNLASLGVSRKLGYLPDGIRRQSIRGRPAAIQMLRLDRAGWQAHRQVPVEITGLAPCLPSFGLPPP